jgi:hypothetical protein
MIDIKSLIQSRVQDDAEEIRRAKELPESYHASLLGGCERQIFLTKIHAKEFSLDVKMKMAVGSAIHNHIQSYKEIREVFDVEVPLKYQIKDSPAFILGSADLVAKDLSLVADIKSIASLKYVVVEPIKEHLIQLNVYLNALGLIDGQILYVDKVSMEIVVHPFKSDNLMFEETCKKVIRVYNALKIWETSGAFNNPIPFEKCQTRCFGCETEQIKPNFQKLLKG